MVIWAQNWPNKSADLTGGLDGLVSLACRCRFPPAGCSATIAPQASRPLLRLAAGCFALILEQTSNGGPPAVQTTVTTRHGHLTETTQERVISKADKLQRFFDRLTAIEVIVDLKESSKPRVDIKVSAEHKHDFMAHHQSDNLMTSVESTVQKLEQQLKKYKQKLLDRHRDAEVKRIEPGANDPDTDDVELGDDDLK